jgi:ParB family chromosome partitioning protein
MADDGFTVLDMGQADLMAKKAAPVEVVHVPVGKIVPNPYQPRKTFEEESLLDLASSIRQYGVLQPLLVAPYENGNYLLIAGERRLRASQMAGLTELPVIISEYTSQQIAEVAMIENLQREDLHYLEEAEGYEKLLREFHMTEEVMATRVGKKQSTVANKLRLLKLPLSVRTFLRDNDLTERHARVLLKLRSEEEQLSVLDTVVKKNYNVRQTEALVEKYPARYRRGSGKEEARGHRERCAHLPEQHQEDRGFHQGCRHPGGTPSRWWTGKMWW